MAKDCLRIRARELRALGWSVNDLATELSVARSTAWRWVRDLPLDPDSERARRKREQGRVAAGATRAASRETRERQIAEVRRAAAGTVCGFDERELRLVGAAIYWCEGKKAKPWRPLDRVVFVNSDPGLIDIFLRFLAVMGVASERVGFRLYIHETADVAANEAWWARRLGVGGDRFKRTVRKRHRPRTPRRNTAAAYHGCLAVEVARSRQLYWQIAGIMDGLVEGLAAGTPAESGDFGG